MEVESMARKLEPRSSQRPPFSYSVEAQEVPLSPPMDPVDSHLGFPYSALTADTERGGVPVVHGEQRSPGIETKSSVVGGEDGFGSSDQLKKPKAAVKLQKVYRSYRTRRLLADSVVVAEELWWQAIDFARLSHSTVSFFNFQKPESAASRWSRISLNAAKVGKGLSKDTKAQKLAFQHWIEAIDPRHRYGHNLHFYYEEWCKADAGQPFFYWLDIGDGTDVNLEQCPRLKLRRQCITYLGPQEREHYEYIIVEGKMIHKLSGCFLDTNKESREAKWIFVTSASKKLYAGEKKKGSFHHSSFLAGGVTLAAGRLESEDGILKTISAYSGHYRPTDDSLDSFLSFLKENGVNLDQVQIRKANEDLEGYDEVKPVKGLNFKTQPAESASEEGNLAPPSKPAQERPSELKNEYKRTLSGGLQSPRAEVPTTAILQRINSKKSVKSYQLGHQISLRWCSGAGPRIGCVADYPVELRVQALEFVNLSPRTPCRRTLPEQNTSDKPAGC